MGQQKNKDKFYFITLNLLKDKHEDLIEWIKQNADVNEQSLSAFCIKILKEKMNKENK